MLRGVYGTEGQPPWLRLEGPIAPDGSAALIAQGQSGDPDYAAGRVRAGTRVNYRIDARFSGARGSGRRLDNRPCDLTFVRHDAVFPGPAEPGERVAFGPVLAADPARIAELVEQIEQDRGS